ncbi:MAG: type II toxin-antitoxin system HicA family toxin [Thermomicrobiales bacterium]
MPSLRPIKRVDLIRHLRHFGFTGPRTGTKHEFMQRDEVKITIPNPHGGDIGVGLLARILRQAGISREEWERL